MKIFIIFLCAISLEIITGQNSNEVKTEDVYTYEGDDFAEIVKTTLFVDKTMLIKQFFDRVKHGAGALIIAPRKYGKSINMDMLKRFYQINLDVNGQPVAAEKTLNYRIFEENYLNIYQCKVFFHNHFGKHPVIHIDYKALIKVQSVEELLGIFFGAVMMPTFLQHKYLLNDTFLWSLNKTNSWVDQSKFKQYLDKNLCHKLTESDIHTGFSFLARLLNKRFEKRVIVLLDNYDAFVDSPLFSQNQNIFHLLSAVNSDLLRSDSVERSLVTGIPRPSGPSIPRGQILPSNVEDCQVIWQYYGISGQELETLLEPYIQDVDERQKAIGRIVHSYSGYGVATLEADDGGLLNTQGVSVWSVVQYLEKELNVENFSSLV